MFINLFQMNIYEGLQICKIYLSRDVDPHGHASLWMD